MVSNKKFSQLSQSKRATLFLLRTYNDIDHIVPVIWKAATSGWPTYLLFVDRDYSDDYRIKFILQEGAILLESLSIKWYHTHLRKHLKPRCFRRLLDYLVAYSFGLCFLVRYRIQVAVNEWSGPFGRNQAEYFLRSTRLLKIPVVSLPHGYFLYTNPFFNRHIKAHYEANGRFPDFSNRNWYSKYIVQSEEHRSTNIEYGIESDILIVLGSARFCEQWSSINLRLLKQIQNTAHRAESKLVVLFFLPHWDYNVHRNLCLSLLSRIAAIANILLIIKAHTRGTGSLSDIEKTFLDKESSVMLAEEVDHSTLLIDSADVVINFGSSIGFEALRQEKTVINPTYLHENGTFFDRSGAVYDAKDEDTVLKYINACKERRLNRVTNSEVRRFLLERVDGNEKGRDVLQDYLSILCGQDLNTIRNID
jgi:hypothetical protein